MVGYFSADLDPIYYCQLLSACPYNDHGDANFNFVNVNPDKGPQGWWCQWN